MQLACTVDAKYHDKGKPGVLVVFLPRRHHCQVAVAVRSDPKEKTDPFGLPVGDETFEEDAPLSCWLYMHRELIGDDNADSDKFESTAGSHVSFGLTPSDGGEETKQTSKKRQKQPYTARIGLCEVELKTLLEKQRVELTLRDVKQDDVGSVIIEVVKPKAVRFVAVDAKERHGAACNKWYAACTEEYAALLETKMKPITETNVTELQRHEFSAIQQEIGAVPIWAWVYGNTHWEEQQRAAAGGDAERFKELQRLAEIFTGRGSDGKNSYRELEVINEMVTLQTRATLYVLDTTMGRHRHDNSCDDWTNIRHNPAMFEAGADCEDLAVEILRECTALRNLKGNPLGSLLKDLYLACFAIVTLKLDTNAYTYHAVCIQVPRSWLVGDKKNGISMPVLLHEGTSYTTGCWEFDSPDCTLEQYDASHIETPVESACKVPASKVRSNDDSPYGHVVSLFCPELLETKGIAQLEVLFKGKLGAPIKEFMRASNEVSFVSVEAPQNWQALVRYLMYWMPVPAHFEDSFSKGDDPVAPKGTELNCIFRECDFSDAVKRKLSTRVEAGKPITIRRIVLPGSGSVLVQCTSPK